MKNAYKQNLIAVALIGALSFTTAQAQQVPQPKTAAEVPGPAAGTAMTKEYVQTVGRMDGPSSHASKCVEAPKPLANLVPTRAR